MSPHFILLAARGLHTQALFNTDRAEDALNAMAALALLAPELRIVLYVSVLGEASRRVLVVDGGTWSIEGTSARMQEAA